jgi:riboflavin kinase/FMN adenylyltransferase
MEIFRGRVPQQLRPEPRCITLGNFDGVHRGHQALIQRVIERAKRNGLASLVMTFDPLPQAFFAPESAPARLTRPAERLVLLRDCGVDAVWLVPFNRALAATSAESFIDDMLIGQAGARHVVLGDDLRFGQARRGDLNMVAERGRRHGVTAEALPSFLDAQDQRISSTVVRAALAEGDLKRAESLLGRPYALSGRVMYGQQLGRELGFPTANINFSRYQPPLRGVFVVEVEGVEAGRRWPGVANLGVRPAVGGKACWLEVHLLDFAGDLYGRRLRVRLQHRLRGEVKFDDLPALQQQILKDVGAARQWHQENQT